MPPMSLEDKLRESRHRPSGFDYLRITLALSVLVWHSFGVPYGMTFAGDVITNNALVRVPVLFVLPAFFTLSGFLVASSLERSPSLFVFLGLRVIRIVPALSVEIFLSALLLGSFFTTLPLWQYYTSPEFFSYFLNIFGDIHYTLPGVFEDNPIAGTMNGQLWTVPWELKCYIALAAFALLGVVRRKRLLVASCTGLLLALVAYEFVFHRHGIDSHNDFHVPGRALVLSFLIGVTLYEYRSRLPFSRGWFLASVATFVALNFVPYGNTLLIAPAAYMTAYLGVTNFRKTPLVRTGDYSYGVYVYHFAIQQGLVSFGPAMRHWYVVLPLSLAATSLFAAFSWFAVEKPALEWRRYLYPIEQRVRGLFGASAAKVADGSAAG